MAITIKCADCGYAKQSDDGAEETCPQCEGTMAPPPKKKYQAKATSLEDEERAKKKKRRDDDDDDDRPRVKKKAASAPQKALSLDDEGDDEKEKGGSTRDGRAAEQLGLKTGFKNKELMRQVVEELSRGEVLHWAGRMCPEIAERKAKVAMFTGIGFAVAGLVFCSIFFAVAPWFVGLIPLVFVAAGIGIAIAGPNVIRKQAARGWYALTDQRAIVFTASAFGSGGEAATYEPSDLRRMRVKAAKSPKGAGDLVFKTKITERRTDYVDRRTGSTMRSETSRTETHYGFLGIEDVREVETLVHKILLGGDDD